MAEFSREVKGRTDSPTKHQDVEEKKIGSTGCTIEEKVMMGIEENLHKCQEQEKVAATEAKQKTAPSLANWFGLRRSKLPALSGKKSDSPKAKDEKKELKLGSVLGGKSDRKKDKKKSDSQHKESPEGPNLCEVNNKLSSIMDHCNNQMGQIANQIQCSTAFMGKDQLVRELLGRLVEHHHQSSALSSVASPLNVCIQETDCLVPSSSWIGFNLERHSSTLTHIRYLSSLIRTLEVTRAQRTGFYLANDHCGSAAGGAGRCRLSAGFLLSCSDD